MTPRPIGEVLTTLSVLYAIYACADMMDHDRGRHMFDLFRRHVLVQMLRGLFHIAVTAALCVVAVEYLGR